MSHDSFRYHAKYVLHYPPAPDGDANADRERSAIEAGERGAPGGGYQEDIFCMVPWEVIWLLERKIGRRRRGIVEDKRHKFLKCPMIPSGRRELPSSA